LGESRKINLIGRYSLHGDQEQLEDRELNGTCKQAQVIAYLETLALKCDPKKRMVVVLDNASFHKGKALKACTAGWEARGLFLGYLPGYCPFLNVIEGVWQRVKGF
jgi:putative transposase